MNKRGQGKYKYRLPTDAEWEYACRAGTDSPFYTGETINPWQARYRSWIEPYGDGAVEKGKRHFLPVKVKGFPPNPWGLYDMHGNVYEVCSDVYDPFFNTYAERQDPRNVSTERRARVARGGAAMSSPVGCMCGNRSEYLSENEHNYIVNGFRLVAEKE